MKLPPQLSKCAIAPEATREQILKEAAKLFRRQGYAATTLRQIAAAIGIKSGSIYYHFESKDEILDLVLTKGMQLVTGEVQRRVDALGPSAHCSEKIGAAIDGHLSGLLNNGEFTSANMWLYSQLPDTLKRQHRFIRQQYMDYWDKLLLDAQQQGEIDSNRQLRVARLFLIGALNWTVEWHNPRRGPFETFSAEIKQFIFQGIGLTHRKSNVKNLAVVNSGRRKSGQ